jgi:hypothetical protein
VPDPDKGSAHHLDETLTVRGTATNAEGLSASANCTTNFTVVKVDVTIGGVGEKKEEKEGTFIQYVADAESGQWTEEGTNALVAVSITCEPENLPADEMITISAPAKSLYIRYRGKYHAIPEEAEFPAYLLSDVEFVLHGHVESGGLRDQEIKVEHRKSGAIDLAKFTNAKLRVTNIKFNHDTSSSSNDAINIRRSCAKGIDVSNGEWIDSGDIVTNEPFCYTMNRAVTVKARFETSGFITSAVIRATCADAGGSLSSLLPTNIVFAGGVSSPEYVEFSMSNRTLSCIDRSGGGILDWSADSINEQSGCDMNNSGPHLVYTILGEPKPPWKNKYGEKENAWTNALELACQWACGAATEHQAASSITIGVNASGRFQYEVKKGESKYVDGANVELTEFISRVNGGDGLDADVNCTDCAAFVVSLSNLIGCELYSSRMGYDFDTRPYTAIGRDSFAPPSWGWGFSYHEVAWSGGCHDGDHVYDACLRVDDTCSSNVSDRSETIPAGMMFSDGSPNAPFAYRECLTPSTLNGYYRCISRPERRIRRGIK